MSVNISVSESGPINLDDILKAPGKRRNLRSSASSSSCPADGEICPPSSPIGRATRSSKRKARQVSSDDDSPTLSESLEEQPDEDSLVESAKVLGTRTLRTIADTSPVSMYVSAPDVRKRQSYTLIFKRECVRRMRHGGISINQMSRETGIDRRCLRSWLKQEAQLGEESQIECTRKRVSGAGRKIAYPQLETKLNEWYEAEVKAGRDVTYRKLSVFIYRLAKECGAPNPLKYSKEFFVKWQKKNGLICKVKNTPNNSQLPSSSKDYDNYSETVPQKSIMDLLFEGIDERFEFEESRNMPNNSLNNALNERYVRNQQAGSLASQYSEHLSCAELSSQNYRNGSDDDESCMQFDAPPPLSPYRGDDECYAETPPHLHAEND